MYQSDKEFAFEFLRGAGFVLLVMGTFFAFVLMLGGPAEKNPEKFEVIDHYGTCAVVKYNPPKRAESVFFLDCREVR
jgi:hypothetical protein